MLKQYSHAASFCLLVGGTVASSHHPIALLGNKETFCLTTANIILVFKAAEVAVDILSSARKQAYFSATATKRPHQPLYSTCIGQLL